MKRALHAAGVALTAAALCLTTAISASAATGQLVLDGKVINNPSGCYNSDRWPLFVDNRTDQPVLVFDGQNCQGRVLQVVDPGDDAVSVFGHSVQVP
ncbi:hypothetical protein ACIGXM_24330 [Kitasatospora sp. NPDC052896]|uniref:hypothetical protein n=1 Tax=Kitasatospora sp. NPDC052896 TaxID=3364061 RepID=UPI0037C80EE9